MFVRLKNHEIRVDAYAHWGFSDLYFETTTDGEVLRQIVAYEIGIRLRYDQDNRSDRYGMLNQGKIDTTSSEFKPLSKDQFWHIWQKRNPLLCQTLDDDTISLEELEQNEIDLPISDRL